MDRHSKHSIADIVDPSRARPSRSRIQPKPSDIEVALSGIAAEKFCHTGENPQISDQQFLLSLKSVNHRGIKNTIIQRLKQDSFCSDALILHRCPGDQFKVFSTNEAVDNSVHSTRIFPGIAEVFSKRVPIVLDNSPSPWKSLFYYKPQALILIPINITRMRPKKELRIECIAVLSYTTDHLPNELVHTEVFTKIITFCNLTAPVLYNVQRFDDIETDYSEMTEMFESIQSVVKQIQDVSSCINTICLESLTLFHCKYAVMFLIEEDPFDPKILKYCSFGGGTIGTDCPDRECHGLEEIPLQPNYPVGWSAIHKKCVRANDPVDLASFCGAKNVLHSIGGCVVNNIMCLLIEDMSNDMSLVLELSEKQSEFTEDDQEKALVYARRISSTLTTSILLDFRKRAVRRNEITNKIINNIKTVTVKKVRHLLEQKFDYSNSFKKRFDSYNFIMRKLDPVQVPSIILYMFNELKFIFRWKMRKATVIRFILSVKQAYRDNPYHNFKHAITTTHFAFVLLKESKLQKDKFLTDLEALSLFVSCLCHDVDHRGVNSRFMGLIDQGETSAYLFAQEEGLVQRQHLALTLQIISSEDCNIAENMGDEEYQEFIQLVQLCILATDISTYLQSRDKIFDNLKHFDKNSALKRKSFLSVIMTVCNLAETVKPWDEYLLTVRNIFSEFFAQGDEEIKHGVTPNPTMDKRTAYIPQIEMKFINEIVRPAFQAINELIHNFEECVQRIDYFKELWLVSTKIFQDFAHISNPLEILEKAEMKEDNLKSMPHLALEKRAQKIRRSFTASSSYSLQVAKGSSHNGLPSWSLDFNSLSFHATDPRSVLTLGDYEMQKEAKRKCFRRLSFLRCCCNRCSCKRRGLDDAALVRRCNLEEEFLEEQSLAYEKRRSFEDTD